MSKKTDFKSKFLALGAHQGIFDLKDKLAQSEIDLSYCKFADLEIYVKKNKVEITLGGEDISKFDYVWLTSTWGSRSIAYAASLFLQDSKSDFSPVEQENSKLGDILLFGLNGISIPDTYFTGLNKINERLNSIVDWCGYPFIIKPFKGSRGRDIHLVTSKKQFNDTILLLNPDESYVFQKFIPNNFDYRILMSHDKVVSASKNTRSSDKFRNNLSLGGQEVFINVQDLPNEVSEIAVKTARVLDLKWAGIDIVVCKETGKSYVLELNRSPGLTSGSSEVTAAYDHIMDWHSNKLP